MDVTNPVVKSFLAGSFSGTCSTILFQPLDLVKTKIQQNAQLTPTVSTHHQCPYAHLNLNVVGYNGSVNSVYAVNGNNGNYRPGIFATLRIVITNDTVLGLWRGITPSITRTVPGVGLYFGSLHWLKTSGIVGGGTEKPSPLQAICLGMTARSVAGCAMIPITVLKTRFESGKFGYTHMSSALLEIWRSEGVRGLCCGLVPTLVRDAPYSGLYLMFYTQLKQHVAPYIVSQHQHHLIKDGSGGSGSGSAKLLQSINHFACGIAAGLLASTVTNSFTWSRTS